MPIEFHCRRCGKLLHTPDDAAGKQAKCPECEEIQPIPTQSVREEAQWEESPQAEPGPFEPGGLEATAPSGPSESEIRDAAPPGGFPPPPPPMDPPGVPSNPYQSPGDYGPQSPPPIGQGEFAPRIIDLGDCFGTAWTIFTNRLGVCLFVGLGVLLVSSAVNGALGTLPFAFAVRQHQFNFRLGMALNLQNIVATLFGMWLVFGTIRIFLSIVRGGPADPSVFFSDGVLFVRYMIASILFSIITTIGFILCIIPGIIFFMMFIPYAFLILDRKVSVITSFEESMRITKGNKLTMFGMAICLFLLSILAAIPCGLGFFVFIPYVFVLLPVTYLRMTNQPIGLST